MSTSTRYPTTNAVGSTGFTNAGNAYSSNDSYATAAPGVLDTISSYFGGFDFASYIPSGATINSVTVYCERKFSTTASNASSTLRPYNGTTSLASENENTSEPTTDTAYSVNFGALGVTDVRSADFRILVGAKRGSGSTGYTYSLDVVYVVVDYTAGAYSLTCDAGSFSISGQDVTYKHGHALPCEVLSMAITGYDAGLFRSELLACSYRPFTISGQACTLTYTSGYSLTCEVGSFTLSGQDVSLNRALILACDYSSLALNGQQAAMTAARTLAAEAGSLALTGQDVTLTFGPSTTYSLEAAYATLTLTGQDLSFISGVSLSCVYAAYALSFQSVTLFLGL